MTDEQLIVATRTVYMGIALYVALPALLGCVGGFVFARLRQVKVAYGAALLMFIVGPIVGYLRVQAGVTINYLFDFSKIFFAFSTFSVGMALSGTVTAVLMHLADAKRHRM